MAGESLPPLKSVLWNVLKCLWGYFLWWLTDVLLFLVPGNKEFDTLSTPKLKRGLRRLRFLIALRQVGVCYVLQWVEFTEAYDIPSGDRGVDKIREHLRGLDDFNRKHLDRRT